MTAFDWPCSKHWAHGEHEVAEGVICPGVKTHPATMAGREPAPDLMCSACGSKEQHHLDYVIEHGKCVV